MSLKRALRPKRQRRAVAILELVLALPILLIPLLAILRYGLYYANMQQVSLACRLGAEEASQTDGLTATSNGDPVPATVLEAITDQLATAGIQACRVRLEHNVNNTPTGGTQRALATTLDTCDCPATANLASPPPGEYVRVSICVPMTELVPVFLSGFGFGLCGGSETVECSTVFRYELNP